jgi:hypothetical protein
MKFPDLRDVERALIVETARLRPEFLAFRGIAAALEAAAFAGPAVLDFHLRLALESAFLRGKKIPAALARLAAARAAAQFVLAEGPAADRAALPGWVPAMGGDIAPPPAVLLAVAPGAVPEDIAKIRALWPRLGTAEALMETGGDIRLATDQHSALNGYGCSHRPRPWAITFASSTASSSSARGYVAADKVRLRATAAMLRGAARPAIAAVLAAVRAGIARVYGLAGAHIVLAASGTDTELLALALSHLTPPAPILNILIAPEETGRGVPMAARGLHFAVDTALGHDVTFEAPIAGFRPDTALATIPLRGPDGAPRQGPAVEAEIAETIEAGLAAGRKIILHALDLSKTGLLAPSPAFLGQLRARFGGQFDLVVDACQTRLSPASVRAYLALDAVVLITGSKFFTGPPFAGAAVLPPASAARLRSTPLPAGLDAYFGRDEFPASCPAANNLPAVGNYGLALRWHAALAEMRAFFRVPAPHRARILNNFAAVVADKIAANPALQLLAAPAIRRGPADEAWECLPSIFSFLLRAPHEPSRNLTPVEARAVYLWLNADLSKLLPGRPAAGRICHIGQPVKLPQPGPEMFQGVLRVSAGARLISGEPSHRGLARNTRIARELADLAVVFDKIALILDNWALLWAANPQPKFRPAAPHAR